MDFKTTTYLVMDDRDAVPDIAIPDTLSWSPATNYRGSELSDIYAAIGRPHGWGRRFPDAGEQADEQASAWSSWIDQSTTRSCVIEILGEAAGLVDIDVQNNGDVEIVVFGLVPEFVGRGYGKAALITGIRRAWDAGNPTRRVWLHTSSNDHPRALPNYLSCGFRRAGEPVLVPVGTPSPKSMYGLGEGIDIS
jgi:RimJ/RimL family protein N-acetyltransferase